jgi:intracellular protein transport protein USO1
MFAIAGKPAQQSVGDTIQVSWQDRNLQSLTQYQVLAGRLGTAQLLEDRRASIAGIRSLAKQYPASGKLQSSSECIRWIHANLTQSPRVPCED